MTGLRLHNTLSGKVEEFVPAATPVTMYVCGPTVYGEPHVGNARPVVVFDVLYRLLRQEYGAVSYARNITDIDDKIIAAAATEQIDVTAIAAKYTDTFRQAASALGNLVPTHEPCATHSIDEMIELTATLIERGHAYVDSGHVLFAIDSYADYGKLSNRNQDEMLAGARVEVAPYKHAPGDFVLWKPSNDEQPGWDSPWGCGRPGWHLECSAMIKECLGMTIDIHGGGSDLVFPHHENEIAQSRCAFNTPTLARYWLHNGHVTLDGSKMAKSGGNITLLSETLTSYPGEVLRYALLCAHYRSPLDWNERLLADAKASLDRLYRVLVALPSINNDKHNEELPADLLEALRNDLNTPQALACLHQLASDANSAQGEAAARATEQLACAGKFLGLLGSDPADWLHGKAASDSIDEVKINELIAQRNTARASGDFAAADQLRDELAAAGIRLEDQAGTTEWHRQ